MLSCPGRLRPARSLPSILGLATVLNLAGPPLRADTQVEAINVVITALAGETGQPFDDMVVVKEEDPPAPQGLAGYRESDGRALGRLVLQRPLAADLNALPLPPGPGPVNPLATYLQAWDHNPGPTRTRTVAVQMVVAPALGGGAFGNGYVYELDYRGCVPLKWSVVARDPANDPDADPAVTLGARLVEQLEVSFESVVPQVPTPYSGAGGSGWNQITNKQQ